MVLNTIAFYQASVSLSFLCSKFVIVINAPHTACKNRISCGHSVCLSFFCLWP